MRLLSILHDRFRRSEHMYMVLISVVVGALAGLSAVGFRMLIRLTQVVAWQKASLSALTAEPYTLDYIYGLPIWWKILAPSVGGLIVGLVVYKFAKEARGHGVPEVMEAIALKAGKIRPRVVAAKFFASAVCIGSGGSVGREGPIVQIGAALGSTIGQWLRIDQKGIKTLVGCGAAAGIAAAFNAPIAGALFAVEIILGDFGVAQFSPIVISSVVGTVVSQHFMGDFPAFSVPEHSLVSVYELFAYGLLGILAGFVAILFTRFLYAGEVFCERLKIYPPLVTLIGGALVGIIGIFLPHVFGVGYEAINAALNGTMAWKLMLLLVLVKIIAVTLTIGSGGSGGVFAPSLFIGAMLGGAIGTVVHLIWPESSGGPGAYALVGMGAVVGAATHAPITAIVIIFELTGDYRIILPLMISCIIATLLATQLHNASIYTEKLIHRGIDVHSGRAVNVLQDVPVREQMRTDIMTASWETSVMDIVSMFMEQPGNTVYVIDDQQHLMGILTLDDIKPAMMEPSLTGLLIAKDLMQDRDFPTASPDDSLAEIMRYLGRYEGEMPVVSDGRLVGMIKPSDVIDRYNSELFKRDMAQGIVNTISHERSVGFIPTVENAVVAEVEAPASFFGKTIRDLDIRRVFGFTVLMIKKTKAKGSAGGGEVQVMPRPDYAFQSGDVMVVLGMQKNLRSLSSGVPLQSRQEGASKGLGGR